MLDEYFGTLTAHIGFGAVAVIAGAIALMMRKGAPLHKKAGHIFVWTMTASSLLGAVLGLIQFETHYITFHAGILGATLVTSGILAARLRDVRARHWFKGVALINLLNAVGLLVLVVTAARQTGGFLLGFSWSDYAFLCGMSLVATVCDATAILRTSLTDRGRIAQHLWRMCFGFFIAAGSAFTGPGSSAYPEAIRNSGVLALPEMIIFVLMLYWLFVTLKPRRANRVPIA